MSALRIRITAKIATLCASGVIGLLVTGGIYIFGVWSQEHFERLAADAQSIAEEGAQIQVLLLESRRAEKDFLLRNDLKYVVRHDELRAAIGGKLDAVRADFRRIGDAKLGEDIELVRNGLRAYADSFARIAEAKRRLGLDADSGLEGQ